MKTGQLWLAGVALCAFGCGAMDSGSDAEEQEIEQSTEAITAYGEIAVVITDGRRIDDLVVDAAWWEGADCPSGGGYHCTYNDWEAIGSFAPGSGRMVEIGWSPYSVTSCEGGYACYGNILYTMNTTMGDLGFVVHKNQNRGTQSPLGLKARFTIDGACHRANWLSDAKWGDHLVLDAWGGHWDGECWVGDFLRR